MRSMNPYSTQSQRRGQRCVTQSHRVERVKVADISGWKKKVFLIAAARRQLKGDGRRMDKLPRHPQNIAT